MRLYSFQNFYFAGIHAGIQTAHSVAEIAVKYQNDPEKLEQFIDWAEGHKTIIVKNGGMAGDLRELIKLFSRNENEFPWAQFHEDEYAADGCLTNVSIIVPARIWEMADMLRRNGHYIMNIPGKGLFAERDTVTMEYTDLRSTAGINDQNGVVKFGAASGYVHSVHYFTPLEVYEQEFAKTYTLKPRPGKHLVEYTEFELDLMRAMNRCGLM